jgi:large subunit ribosomal protein L22
MEAIAKARFQRISPRKARVVLNMVRGKNAAVALNELRFTSKAAAPIVYKLIDSAIANVRLKDDSVDLDELVIKVAFADKAPEPAHAPLAPPCDGSCDAGRQRHEPYYRRRWRRGVIE